MKQKNRYFGAFFEELASKGIGLVDYDKLQQTWGWQTIIVYHTIKNNEGVRGKFS
jgi:hypothetical protein